MSAASSTAKSSHDQVFLIVDGGMHHHLAASGNFGQVMRRNYPVAVNRLTAKEVASVTGPLCTPLDLLADRAELDVAEPGDLIVVFFNWRVWPQRASPRGFLSHPDVIEALV